MVDFNTRIFSEDDGKIIGAEITVYSDSGNKIGNISVADAETLEEMQAQLAVIDETYFTEARLQAILANTNENTPINATTLSGFLSSDFAKVSQLSNYAPLSHDHSVSQITGLYDYQITASSYNVDIDSDVTITVKVTNRATGQPVVGVNVPVLKDNETWKSGTTGVNGTFSLSYTCDSWGLITFSANTHNPISISVKGYKLVETHRSGLFNIYANEELIELRITGQYTLNSKTQLEIGQINSEYAPSSPLTTHFRFDHTEIAILIETSGTIKAYNSGSSQYTGNIHICVTYFKK